jgi:hypothetical protein
MFSFVAISFILVIKKNSKRRIFCQRFVAFRKNSPTFGERNYLLHSTEFLVESKFSACFQGFGVLFTKQFVVFSSVFCVWNFFLETLLLLMEKLAKYITSQNL